MKPLVLATVLLQAVSLWAQKDPADYVNPFIGTDFHGHTYPGATVPFGMVQLSPDTRLSGWDGCSGYHYTDRVIYGFSHTHLSGTGASDYGDILFAPVVGKSPIFESKKYSSPFNKNNEQAKAGYYSVFLDKYKVKAELTTTARVGFHKYTYAKPNEPAMVIDLSHRDKVLEAWFKVVGKNELRGYRHSSQWAKDQKIYFVARFSEPFALGPKFTDDSGEMNTLVNDDGTVEVHGTKLKAWVLFPKLKNKVLLVKVGISFVSEEGALKNLEAEVPGWDFDGVVEAARKWWNDELSKIQVEGGTPEELTTFYTAMYHAMVVPNIFSDVDGLYRTMDGNVRYANGFTPYTVFSIWDTYRAWHPLMTIIDTKRTSDYINTFLSHYRYGGRLPVWELAANETDCMIGYHSVSVIADAWIKGIRGFDAEYAFQAMKHSANLNHFGLLYYKRYGFIPGDMEHESVSKTLEYAYDDWCIAQMAKGLGKHDDYSTFIKRAQSYKNLYDPDTRLMRPRLNGGFKHNFNPAEVDQHFTEANSWQYSFYVPHDVTGLISLHGGMEKFEAKLDDLFSAPSQLAGRNQVDITGLIGQYAHGNEPSHHMAYLYNYVGKPWKTQQLVKRIMVEMYSHKPDGICGNEDCGQMSAWYIMSAMGFYPLCPGSTQNAIGSPLFPKIAINIENGKKFTVIAENLSNQNIYIQSATLNGKPITRSWIDHTEIMAGGELVLTMDSIPSDTWGTQPVDLPSTSINENPITIAPFLVAASDVFTDTLTVAISSVQPDAQIFYSVEPLDKPLPKTNWKQGNRVTLTESQKIRAFAILPNGQTSAVVEGTYRRVNSIANVQLKSKYSSLYTAGGDLGLVDGVRGAKNFRIGGWQGYQGQDFEAVVDLGEVKPVKQISAGFLQDASPWIMMPREVSFSVSTDGQSFVEVGTIKSDIPENLMDPTIKDFTANVDTKARFVKVYAKAFGPLPSWHESAGEPSWLFIDEITIK
ncbi:GH92 family glycosyl hydrolase [Tenuifilum osseticum]|uniref:GH92 family glycosyl hydrolase n=1 Tax=Tenuifilum osseticum TaxID=3374723 RepID=UPI0034E4F270